VYGNGKSAATKSATHKEQEHPKRKTRRAMMMHHQMSQIPSGNPKKYISKGQFSS